MKTTFLLIGVGVLAFALYQHRKTSPASIAAVGGPFSGGVTGTSSPALADCDQCEVSAPSLASTPLLPAMSPDGTTADARRNTQPVPMVYSSFFHPLEL